jgi:hypothetical protein
LRSGGHVGHLGHHRFSRGPGSFDDGFGYGDCDLTWRTQWPYCDD